MYYYLPSVFKQKDIHTIHKVDCQNSIIFSSSLFSFFFILTILHSSTEMWNDIPNIIIPNQVKNTYSMYVLINVSFNFIGTFL